MDSSYQTPDLASVLATLAAYGPPQSTAPQPTIPYAPPVPEVEEEEEEYDPADFQFIDTHSSVASQSKPVSSIAAPKSIQFVHQPPPPSSVSSASQIVTWAPALRYVMNNVFRKPEAMHSIQHMIKTQQQHERQWWEGRKALLQKQASRDDARKKLDDVLSSVGGRIKPLSQDSSSQINLNELSQYDRKVHHACKQMISAATAELATFNVPFFAIDGTLIIRNANKNGEVPKGKILEKDLEELKAKMIKLLEDLCGE